MSSHQIASHRENAEIYTGDSICKQKSKELLAKINMPNGLLPLEDLVEVGYNESTGFVWLTQKASRVHTFKKIGKKVSYDKEITAFVEEHKMKRVTGVKSKELLLWITLSDIYIDKGNPDKISFATPAGLSRSYDVSAFEEDESEK